jgi:hypothetical protein
MPQRHRLFLIAAAIASAALALAPALPAGHPQWTTVDPLTGPRSRLSRDWIGLRPLPADTQILILAGHADSQGIAGAGTGGEAVDLHGAAPMQPGIRDELHWNLLTAQAVVALGRQRGLGIRFYDPPARTILDGDDPRTNWSVGREHVSTGGYALEIHYDAYGPDGVGSGLIPPLHRQPSQLDESLAAAFGNYPLHFRGGLGAPRRGIAILEIGKLEGVLEAALRDPGRREATLNTIALRVVEALERGLGRPGPVVSPALAQEREEISPRPDGEHSAPRGRRR